jgi:hypothetical protein
MNFISENSLFVQNKKKALEGAFKLHFDISTNSEGELMCNFKMKRSSFYLVFHMYQQILENNNEGCSFGEKFSRTFSGFATKISKNKKELTK